MTSPTPRRGGRTLAVTLVTLGAMVVFIEIGLATDRNWSKMIRVAVAALGYVAVLLGSGALRHPHTLWRYVVAGLVAGILSGVVRPETRPALIVVQAVLAALLLGPAHWLLVRRASPDLDRPPGAR